MLTTSNRKQNHASAWLESKRAPPSQQLKKHLKHGGPAPKWLAPPMTRFWRFSRRRTWGRPIHASSTPLDNLKTEVADVLPEEKGPPAGKSFIHWKIYTKNTGVKNGKDNIKSHPRSQFDSAHPRLTNAELSATTLPCPSVQPHVCMRATCDTFCRVAKASCTPAPSSVDTHYHTLFSAPDAFAERLKCERCA